MKSTKPQCSIEGCDRPVSARGWCQKHYNIWYRAQYDLKRCSMSGCERPHLARGLCKLHYYRKRRTGTTEPTRLFDVEERFWANVQKGGPGECWLWTGLLTDKGYGRVFSNGRYLGAHRFSYRLHEGPVPKGLFVCHRCDNPRCVNPDHLWLGTNADNMADMAEKGRANHEPRMLGESHTRAKLTEKKVREIRRLRREGLTLEAIAKQYGVCFQTVSLVVNRKSWAHVD